MHFIRTAGTCVGHQGRCSSSGRVSCAEFGCERGEGDVLASGVGWTKAMCASLSSGERSERTDVAGEGIAKAAAGKSACFGASSVRTTLRSAGPLAWMTPSTEFNSAWRQVRSQRISARAPLLDRLGRRELVPVSRERAAAQPFASDSQVTRGVGSGRRCPQPAAATRPPQPSVRPVHLSATNLDCVGPWG